MSDDSTSGEGSHDDPTAPIPPPGDSPPLQKPPAPSQPFAPSQPPQQGQHPAYGQRSPYPPGQPMAPGAGPYGPGPQAQAPYGQGPQGQGPYGQVPYGPNPYAVNPYGAARRTNTSAIVLVIVAGVSTLFTCLTAIPALIFGILALVKQNDEPAESQKFTRWGWIAYAIGVAVYVLAVVGLIAIGLATSGSGNSPMTGAA